MPMYVGGVRVYLVGVEGAYKEEARELLVMNDIRPIKCLHNNSDVTEWIVDFPENIKEMLEEAELLTSELSQGVKMTCYRDLEIWDGDLNGLISGL